MPFPSLFWLINTKNYINLVEKSFIKESEKLDKKYMELNNQQEKTEFREDRMEDIANDSCTLEFINKQSFRHSVIISTYSFIENQLKEICDGLDNRMSLLMKPKDFAGLGIDKYSKYLLYTSSIDIKKNKKYSWEELERIKKIRNILVHESGVMDNTDKDINIYISKNKNLSINHNKLFIEKEYLIEVLNLTETFFDYLENELEEKLPNIFNDFT